MCCYFGCKASCVGTGWDEKQACLPHHYRELEEEEKEEGDRKREKKGERDEER